MEYTKNGQIFLPKHYSAPVENKKPRGISTTHVGGYIPITGRTDSGATESVDLAYPNFILSPRERWMLFQQASTVFGIITSRANNISGLKFKVVSDKDQEDIFIYKIKMMYEYYIQFIDIAKDFQSLEHYVVAENLRKNIMKQLDTVRPDLTNFEKALSIWRKTNSHNSKDNANMVEDLLSKPDGDQTWPDFIAAYITDLLLHGSVYLYKAFDDFGRLKKIVILPGGSVYPVYDPYYNHRKNIEKMYVQYIPGFEPQIFNSREMSSDLYMPNSLTPYGMVPLDAVYSKICYEIISWKYWNQRADGSKLAEKLIVFGGDSTSIFGSGNADVQVDSILDPSEKERFEIEMTQLKQNAVAVLRGTGNAAPTVVDVGTKDIGPQLMDLILKANKATALAFNASAMEMGESGSDATNGLAVAEVQERVDNKRGIFPNVISVETTITQIIKQCVDKGLSVQLQTGMTDIEYMRYLKSMLDTGLKSTNQIKREELNEDPFQDKRYDFPIGHQEPVATTPGIV